MKRKPLLVIISILIVLAFVLGNVTAEERYQTENVIIAVMDGVRWTETFGDPEHKHIPEMWKNLRDQGTLYTNFYNNDVTITRAGHSTMATGTWQKNRNRGPRHTMPTIFEYIRDELQLPKEKVWVIFGKGNYAYDPTSSFPFYGDRFDPSQKIGLGESSIQYDNDVLEKILEVMEKHQPRLIFANFGSADHLAHSGIWERHIKAIENQDKLYVRLWNEIQSRPGYKDKTTLMLVNDHGLQDDGVYEGFAEHGSLDEGCRHVMFFMLGPDVKKGHVVENNSYLIDIAPTVGELLGYQTPLVYGEVLKDGLVKYLGLNRKEAVTKVAKRAKEAEELARKDLVRYFADKVISKYEDKALSLEVNSGTAMLLWGMLSAYDKEKDERYLQFVLNWADRHLEKESSEHVGLVLAELAYRIRDLEKRKVYIERARAIADMQISELEEALYEKEAESFSLKLIFLSSLAELAKERELWLKTKDLIMNHLRALDLEIAEAYVAGNRDLPQEYKRGEEVVKDEGKVLPATSTLQGISDNSWYLLALSFVRSHGLPFKGEYFRDVPGLKEESFLQTYYAVKGLSGPGEIWEQPLKAAINIAAIKEFMRRKNLYAGLEGMTVDDFVRIRPDSPELLPSIDKLRMTIANTTFRTNYNIDYGLPPYRDIDFTLDLLRLHVGEVNDNLTVGAFLLALDPQRHVPFKPAFPSPRD